MIYFGIGFASSFVGFMAGYATWLMAERSFSVRDRENAEQ